MDLGQQEYNKNSTSPLLPNGIKNYLIDIDGTITEDVPNEEPWRMETCLPYSGSIDTINDWYSEGHIITFFTSRTENHRKITEEWLQKHGYFYHNLLMNKPIGGNYHWVDNHIVRSTRYKGKFTEMETVMKEILVFKE